MPDSFLVQQRPCPTCIYGPHSASHRAPAALEEEITDPQMPGFFVGYRICHYTREVCCAGFWQRHRNAFTLGQVAQRMGWVVYVDEDERKEKE